MINKIIRGLINAFRIIVIRINCRGRAVIPVVQPMRVNSQLMVQKKIKKVMIGKNFRLESNARVRVIDEGELEVGNNCFINCNSYITVEGKTVIRDNVLIGPNTMIFDHDHDYKSSKGIRNSSNIIGEIYIGNNVWIGAGCIILRGAHIEDDAVIAAGSIVKGKVDAGCVYVQKRKSESIQYKEMVRQ